MVRSYCAGAADAATIRDAPAFSSSFAQELIVAPVVTTGLQ